MGKMKNLSGSSKYTTYTKLKIDKNEQNLMKQYLLSFVYNNGIIRKDLLPE
jgi:hypothetical protein